MAILLLQTFDPKPRNMQASRNWKTVMQCLASYFRDTEKFSIFFPVVFRLAQLRNFGEKKHGKFHGTQKFDANIQLVCTLNANNSPQDYYKMTLLSLVLVCHCYLGNSWLFPRLLWSLYRIYVYLIFR